MAFVGSTNTINIIMFDLIDIYSFNPVRGCVGMGPRALLCPGSFKCC